MFSRGGGGRLAPRVLVSLRSLICGRHSGSKSRGEGFICTIRMVGRLSLCSVRDI